jgi:hypothetical protein
MSKDRIRKISWECNPREYRAFGCLRTGNAKSYNADLTGLPVPDPEVDGKMSYRFSCILFRRLGLLLN